MTEDQSNSGDLLPVPAGPHQGRLGPAAPPAAAPPPWVLEEEDEGLPVGRYLRAIWRRKWVLVVSGLFGAAVSFWVWRTVPPLYMADGSVRINNLLVAPGSPGSSQGGPALTMGAAASILLRPLVLDTVVIRERLYVQSHDDRLATLRASAVGYRPGSYEFSVGPNGETYTLRRLGTQEAETGRLGDSAGALFGFRWIPDPRAFEPGDRFNFSLIGIRDASTRLAEQVIQTPSAGGEINELRLEGPDPEKITRTLNTILEVYEEKAWQIKLQQQNTQLEELRRQQAQAQAYLTEVAAGQQAFDIDNVTQPGTPVGAAAPGTPATQNPAFTNYFALRTEQANLEAARNQLVNAMADTVNGGLPIEVLERLPDVRNSVALWAAIQDLATRTTELRNLRAQYTDEAPQVQQQITAIERLERVTIPPLVGAIVDAMQREIDQLEGRIEEAETQLQAVPERVAVQADFARRMEIATADYNRLTAALSEARIANVSEIPDVEILDYAQVPSVPNSDNRVRLAGMAFAAALMLGALIALFLERSDSTVRFPEHVTGDLGLTILGGIPKLRGGRTTNSDQALEAFRDLRLNVMYAYGSAGPIVLALSSPGAGEGKSFISANLALVFAELGRKTILVDGDSRRGAVQELFGLARKPGLVDFLAGTAAESEVVRRTAVANLDLIPSGTRSQHAPELLASAKMREFMGDLKKRYEVIIVDTPPLGAGADAFLLGTLTGHLALILRTGASDRDLAAARLEPLDRLPVRLLGAILNDVSDKSSPGYYYAYYLPGYGAEDEAEEESTQVIAASVTATVPIGDGRS